MNFNDRAVRERFISHLRFAIETVDAVTQDKGNANEIEQVVKGMNVALVLAILNYTLVLDNRLKNSLIGENVILPQVGT